MGLLSHFRARRTGQSLPPMGSMVARADVGWPWRMDWSGSALSSRALWTALMSCSISLSWWSLVSVFCCYLVPVFPPVTGVLVVCVRVFVLATVT